MALSRSVITSLVILFCCAGCGAPHASNSADPTQTARGGNAVQPAGGADTFDGARAFTQLQAQCDFGPRPMGTTAHDRCLAWIVQQLTPLVDAAPIQQSFPYKSPTTGQSFTVTNVIGRINPTAPKQILLAAHWDTRPFADMDTVPANQLKPILGADDGASGVAVLLELARIFHANRPTAGVEFVFFDGEDYAPHPKVETEMYLGAKYFANHLKGPGGASLKPTYGILLDMIGDKDLNIYEEVNSLNKAPDIVRKVWGAAAALGDAANFIPQTKYTVEDDHLPLLQKGIPVIDCIDFDYETFADPARQYWHTLMDTPDKCSAQSLQIVGSVMSKVVYSE